MEDSLKKSVKGKFLMGEIEEFQNWANGFSMSDDGAAAFRALKIVEKIEFEMRLKGDGFIERIEELLFD